MLSWACLKTLMEMTMGRFFGCHTVTPPSSGPHYLSMHMRGHRHTWRHTHDTECGWDGGEASARGGINPQISHRREKQAGMNVRKRQIYFLSVSRQHKQAILRTPSCVKQKQRFSHLRLRSARRDLLTAERFTEKRKAVQTTSQYCISQEG